MATTEFTEVSDPFADSSDARAAEERKQLLRERVRSLPEMLRVESEDAEPLLGPYVRKGEVTLLGAYGGHGKSLTGLEMVKAIVMGTDFLGYRGEGGVKAVIVDLEQGVSVAQQTVMQSFYPDHYERGDDIASVLEGMKLGRHMDLITHCDWREGVNLSDPGPDLEVFEETIRREMPAVVMIDPVYKLFMGSDTNENVVIGNFVKAIDAMRVKYGFALILPMHPRKPPNTGGTFTMHDLYGSAIWSWWAFCVFLLKRREDGTVKFSFQKDRSNELPLFAQWTLTYTPADGFRRDLAELQADPGSMVSARATNTQKVWDYLQRHSPRLFTREDLIEATGIPKDSVIKATRTLQKKHADGTMYDGLVVQGEDSQKKLYGYRRPKREGDEVIDAVIDAFPGSVEEDEW